MQSQTPFLEERRGWILEFMGKRIRRYILFSLKISIAIFVMFYLYRSGWVTRETLTKFFKVDHIPFLMLSGLCFLIAQMLCASRLVLLLRTINLHLRLFRGFKLVMIGNFFNTVIPGTVGGDLVKGYYLVKSEENRRGQSAGIVIMDRVLGFLALMLIGGTSIIYLLWQKNSIFYPYRYEFHIALSVVGSVSALSAAFFVLSRNQRVREKIGAFFAAIFRKSIFYYLLEGFGVIAKHHQILMYSFFVSILIQLFSLAGLLILGNAISGTFPDIILFAAMSTVVLLLSVIPVTPGNLGWTELIAAFGWSAVGSNAGATIFLSWRIVTVICSLPWGFVFLSMAERRK
jgi:uncharacterized protein (TIRG00374 family)